MFKQEQVLALEGPGAGTPGHGRRRLASPGGQPSQGFQGQDETHRLAQIAGNALGQLAPGVVGLEVASQGVEVFRPALLLVHGLTDDNVYFQHTLQLADALFRAGKPYELLPMLGTHMVSDPRIRMRQQVRIMDFLKRELRP